ncbi:condensation domain-containing protein, partial [Paraburkholderia sp. A1RI_3L]
MSEVDRLLSTLHREGVQIWVHDGELRLRSMRSRMKPEQMTRIRRLKSEIIARLRAPGAPRGLPRADRARDLPLSSGQEALWFLYQLDAGAAYTLPHALKVTGPLDLAALEAAYGGIKLRHEVLRTRIEMADDRPVQRIDPPDAARIVFEDVSAWPEAARAERARRWLGDEAGHAFRLEREHPVRLSVLRIGDHAHLLVTNLHHIAADDWSIHLFDTELAAGYDAWSSGAGPALDALPAQYADYAAWQTESGRGERLERQLAYWRGQLAGSPIGAGLPIDRQRPHQPGFAGRHVTLRVSSPLADSLGRLGRRCIATPFMIFQAAYQATIAHWIGQRDVLIGSPTSVRTHPQTERMIGYFVNMLVIRGRLDDDPSFVALLERTKRTVLDAYEHRDVPFERVASLFAQTGSLSRQPPFQAVLTYAGRTGREPLALRGLQLEPVEIEQDVAQFDLSLTVAETGDGFDARFDYDSALFERETIERLGARLLRLLDAVAEDPSRRLSELSALDSTECAQLRH